MAGAAAVGDVAVAARAAADVLGSDIGKAVAATAATMPRKNPRRVEIIYQSPVALPLRCPIAPRAGHY
jgi:hypothetical protein